MVIEKDVIEDTDELCAIAINRKIFKVKAEPGFLIWVADGVLARFRPSSVDSDASLLQNELGADVSPPGASGQWVAVLGTVKKTGSSYSETVSALGASVGKAIRLREQGKA